MHVLNDYICYAEFHYDVDWRDDISISLTLEGFMHEDRELNRNRWNRTEPEPNRYEQQNETVQNRTEWTLELEQNRTEYRQFPHSNDHNSAVIKSTELILGMPYTGRPAPNSWDRSRDRTSFVDHRKPLFFMRWGYINNFLMNMCASKSPWRGGSRRAIHDAGTVQ